ncbi:hypothetical protein GGTG_07557 [Gaeumannomyces tritici R3-111a-1]|uniref:Zn(2)-C6 fungal-type domain-containing protein n=1 Tax=Gaeumannomyces tritici (strain R3-111a-1) TaxID=644352 RepID=J3P209_GAET3|nr:hypothetical protein GGTG_07557 [Gaeumannomyces tritici R3-111a-1]EJT73701.1 hypothetical protein GGTG_07557 [Gaeumannomyces tritici R3-111a-1]
MPTTMEFPHADAQQQQDQQQSIRSSCDRCRSKKLGCVISAKRTRAIGDAPQQCVRCLRANVDCVFSRRARTTRRNSAANISSSATGIERRANRLLADKTGERRHQLRRQQDQQQQQQQQQPMTPCEPSVLDDPLGEASVASPLSDYGVWFDGFILGALSADPCGTDDAVPPPPPPGVAFSVTALDHDVFIDPTLDLQGGGGGGEPDLDALWGCDADAWTSSWPPPPSPSSPSLLPDTASEFQTLSAASSGGGGVPPADGSPLELCTTLDQQQQQQPGTALHAVRDLSGLVSDIHSTTNNLQLAVAANAQDLDRYPVGQVLTLARRLEHIRASALLPGLGRVPATRRSNHRHDDDDVFLLLPFPPPPPPPPVVRDDGSDAVVPAPLPAAAAAAAAADTPASSLPVMLLVLSCYVSLAKLYATVFAQMQGFVPPRGGGSSSSNAIAITHHHRRLPPPAGGDDDAACSRLYVAVQMLLDEFQAVEDALLCACGGGDDEAERSTPTWFAAQLQAARLMLRQEAAAGGGGLMDEGQVLKAILRKLMYV